jgi:hypothetical protein
MHETRQQNIDMSRPHEHPKRLIDLALIGKVGAHIPACDRKRHKKQNAENKMNARHASELATIIG